MPDEAIRANAETLDRIYLEWSQFTRARTAREIRLEAEVDRLHKQVAELLELLKRNEEPVDPTADAP